MNLKVQVWLLYHHPNFKYIYWSLGGMELGTDGQTYEPITKCTKQINLSGQGHKKEFLKNYCYGDQKSYSFEV